jgi:glyoxylase-like metal-dependent hydrolase (beta-lactamase superfamily II)
VTYLIGDAAFTGDTFFTPDPADNGTRYLKIPLNLFGG